MQKILDFFTENDHFARHCGIELIEARQGFARARMEIQPHHFNGAGTVHGGAIFTLADVAFAAASNSSGRVALAVSATTSFIHAAYGGTLIAEAKELDSSQRLGHYQVTISNDEGQLIAQFQGTAYRKNQQLFSAEN